MQKILHQLFSSNFLREIDRNPAHLLRFSALTGEPPEMVGHSPVPSAIFFSRWFNAWRVMPRNEAAMD